MIRKLSQAFSYNNLDLTKEIKFNTCETIENDLEVDTDRDILEAPVRSKYCNNFNQTIDEYQLAKTIECGQNAFEKDGLSNNDRTMCLDESLFSSDNYKTNKRANEIVTSLAKDLEISEEQALVRLIAKSQLSNLTFNEKISCVASPQNNASPPKGFREKKVKKKTSFGW